jgi:Mn2+/Fe2+ NRAMP family transporter
MAIERAAPDAGINAVVASEALLSPGASSPLTRFLRQLGPGLVTGASDDDPSGIATYAQIGAQFGFGMLWTLLLTYPLMAAIQEVSAWIARVTGVGIAGNMRRYYPPRLVCPLIALVVIANVINLGADIGAMGGALTLLVGGPALLYSVLFGLVSVASAVLVSYSRFARLLKWSTLVLFVYVGTVFTIRVPWRPVLLGSLIPRISLSRDYMVALMAVFGTTISPYLFFWQASQEVQEQKATPGQEPLKRAPGQAAAQLEPMRTDTRLGMALSNAIAFFIVLDTAAALHTKGVTNIQTAEQAAAALRPLAGNFAFVLFSVGIIGTGLLAVPVLAGSAAYALAETLQWPIGLDRKLNRARGFYGVLAIATLLGVTLNFTPINPIRALFWSAVINGVCAAPVMVVMMLMATNPSVTGALTLATPQRVLGWLSTLVMLAVSVVMIVGLL